MTGLPPWLAGQLTQRRMAVRYADLRPSLQTGDVILFAGTRPFSRLIQTATRCVWSHAAMIVRDGDDILCWESADKGVLQHDFAKEYKFSEALRTASAGGEVVAIRLLACTRSEAMLTAYQTFRAQVEGKPYERDKLQLLKAWLGVDAGEEDLSSFFCSELLAETWQRMGLLGMERDSNWYSPKDFSSLGAVRPLRGSLGDEVIVEP